MLGADRQLLDGMLVVVDLTQISPLGHTFDLRRRRRGVERLVQPACSTNELLRLFGVDLALGLQPHAAPHLLEPDWNGVVDQQTTAHVALGFNFDLEGLEPNTQALLDAGAIVG